MFSLHQVRIFQTVATEGSISRAAEKLFLSQPAVSQHIRTLEKNIGTPLLIRGRRGVTLTPAGEVFLKYAHQLLHLSEEAREATLLTTQKGEARQYLHIGATSGIGACLLPHWMSEFYTFFQDTILTLKVMPTADLVHLVAVQEIAFGLVGDSINRAVVEVTHLWDEEAVIVVGKGHPWWHRSVLHADELADKAFVMRENNSLAHAWELQALAEFGVNPQIVGEFNATAAIKQSVIAGMGLALLPCFVIKNELRSGVLKGLRLQEDFFRRPVHLLWTPEGLRLPGVNEFISFLIRNLDNLPVQPVQPDRSQSLANLLKIVLPATV